MTESVPERIRSLADATRYLEGLINRERSPDYAYTRLDLRPIRALLDGIGRPEAKLSVIHVAGSKGKGSTCLFAESILLGLGESVGTFTSPHLESWVERYRVDGKPTDPESLVRAVERARPVVDALREGPLETRPSFFDATTAVAFLIFAEAGVDRALVEVGLGGRLDSTNAVAPAVTCITSIELEHTDKLGETEALIAGEKAGIIKAAVPLVLGVMRPEAEAVIRARAEALAAPLRACGEAFEVESRSESDGGDPPVGSPPGGQGLRFRAGDAFDLEVRLAMSGRPALLNAGLAIECVRALGVHSDGSLAEAAKRALAQRRLPGRIEVLRGDSEVIIDSAHTVESARALAGVLEEIAPDGFELLLSVSGDKDLDGLLDALLPGALRVWATRAEATRSISPEALARCVRERAPDLPIEIVDDPEKAAEAARDSLAPGHRLCATGSIYLAGVARRVLRARIEREATSQ